MGCLFTRSSTEEEPEEPVKKEYSWEKRKYIRKEDFILDNLCNRTVVRLPESIGGQQFLVQNCTNCIIYLLDQTAAINIDNCTGCQIITGPVKGSLFLRNCRDCKLLCACQQFRSRDCSKTDVFLFCMTQPIIESSYKMRFGCYQLFYNGIAKQFSESELEVMNNTWDNIYDFSPNPDEGPNWRLIPEETKPNDIFSLMKDGENGEGDNQMSEEGLNKSILPKEVMLTTDADSSIVPMVAGDRGRISEESCLVIFFRQDQMSESVMTMIRQLGKQSLQVIRSKLMTLPEERVSEMFDKRSESDFFSAAKKGPVIGIEVNGNNCVEICRNMKEATDDGTLIFVAESGQLIELFYSGVDIQMI